MYPDMTKEMSCSVLELSEFCALYNHLSVGSFDAVQIGKDRIWSNDQKRFVI